MNTLPRLTRCWLRLSLLWKCGTGKEAVRLALLNDALTREGKRLSDHAASPLGWRAAVLRGGPLPEEEAPDRHDHTVPAPAPALPQHFNYALVLTVPEEMLRRRKSCQTDFML